MTHFHLPRGLALSGVLLLSTLCGLPQAAAAAPVAPAQAVTDAQDLRFDRAMAAYERNHWPQAFAQFRDLGLEGHAEAARLALRMSRYGVQLYGQPLVLTLAQTAHLQQLQAGRPDGLVAGSR